MLQLRGIFDALTQDIGPIDRRLHSALISAYKASSTRVLLASLSDSTLRMTSNSAQNDLTGGGTLVGEDALLVLTFHSQTRYSRRLREA